MTILETLKTETKTHHQQVERVLISELKSLKTKNDYAKLLNRLYSFYKPLEDDLHQKIDQETIKDIAQRKHTFRIVKDLQALNSEADSSLKNDHIAIPSLSYAIGVMYVIEGSTMGGQIISKMIHKNVNTDGADAVSYFSSYEDTTHHMWTEFKNQVTNMEHTLDYQEVFKGAKDTFSNLEKWLLLTKSSESTSV